MSLIESVARSIASIRFGDAECLVADAMETKAAYLFCMGEAYAAVRAVTKHLADASDATVDPGDTAI